jgi:hypothetical protein
MAAQAVQIYTNAGKMKIFVDYVAGYVAYNLYSDTVLAMSGESLVGKFTNTVDGQYSSKQAIYSFTRPVAEGTAFYLRLKGIPSSGVEDSGNPGPVKYVPAVSENLPLYKPVIMQGFDGDVYRTVKVDSAGKVVTTT